MNTNTKLYNTSGIDFYAELYSSLDNEEESNKMVCLITDEALTEKHVVLQCGHKFNYLALFNDIKAHKSKLNSLEANYVKINEIRCPYCRARQNSLLPYYPELGLPQIIGVNKQHISLAALVYTIGVCEYEACVKTQIHVCKFERDGLSYCYLHYRMRERSCQKEDKVSEKLIEKNKKMALKVDEKKQQAEIKAMAKEDLKKTVLDSLQNTVVSATAGCSQLMKTGLRKGHPCSKPVFCSGVCKRHYKKPDDV